MNKCGRQGKMIAGGGGRREAKAAFDAVVYFVMISFFFFLRLVSLCTPEWSLIADLPASTS